MQQQYISNATRKLQNGSSQNYAALVGLTLERASLIILGMGEFDYAGNGRFHNPTSGEAFELELSDTAPQPSGNNSVPCTDCP